MECWRCSSEIQNPETICHFVYQGRTYWFCSQACKTREANYVFRPK